MGLSVLQHATNVLPRHLLEGEILWRVWKRQCRGVHAELCEWHRKQAHWRYLGALSDLQDVDVDVDTDPHRLHECRYAAVYWEAVWLQTGWDSHTACEAVVSTWADWTDAHFGL